MWISALVLSCAQSQAQLADSLQLEPEPEERFEVNWGADDSTKVNAVTSEVELSGNAFVAMDDIRLEAYRIIYSPQKNQACAFGMRDSLGDWIGRPVMTQGGQTFEQDELCFDLESRRGLSRQAVTVQGEAVFHAEVAKRQS
jgi:lipopolysaccharide assembly outer membrane protein LptD (OstA)